MTKEITTRTQAHRDAFKVLLRREMSDHGVSIRKLASRTGISISAIVKYRGGERDVPLSWVYILAEGIGCHPMTLIPADPAMMMR